MAKKKSAPKGKRTVAKAAVKSVPKTAKVVAAKKGKLAAKAKPTAKSKPAPKPKAPTKAANGASKGVAKPKPKTIAKKAAPVPAKKVATKTVSANKAVAKPPVVATKPSAPSTKATTKSAVAKKPGVPQPAKAAANIMESTAKPAPAPPVPKPVPAKKCPAKERVVMEFYLNSSPNALYELLSTPSGFSEWYCQDVDVRGDQYTFIWDGEREETTLIGRKLGEVIRFRRNDDDDPESFFEFRVRIDAMTNEVCLVVTDHAWPDEVDETRNLWASQIDTLGRVLGA